MLPPVQSLPCSWSCDIHLGGAGTPLPCCLLCLLSWHCALMPMPQCLLVLLLMAHPQPQEGLSSSLGFLGLLLVGLAAPPSLTSADCGEPLTYSNMELVNPAKSVYGVGERVDYQCKPGYMRKPAEDIFSLCGADNNWLRLSNDACYKKSCTIAKDPLNGHVILLNNSYVFGSQIQFVCNDGFYLIGDKILHCLLRESNVHWSGQPPECERILCQPPPSIPNGYYTPSSKDVFQYLEVATYSCNHNVGPDEFSLIGTEKLHCVENDMWSGDPPTCKVVKCPFPSVPNGQQTSGFRVRHFYKATVTFTCNHGFYLLGKDTIVCEANSTWQPPVPRCLPEASRTTNVNIPSTPVPGGSQPTGLPPTGSKSSREQLNCDLGGWIIALAITIFLQEN